MKMTEVTALAVQYDALLCRYARLMTKSQRVAERLVIEVFEEYYETNVLMPPNVLRIWLKSRVLRKCNHYKRSLAFLATPHTNPQAN
ncbi:hypothetical protein [Ferruginibacter sp. HRS2-29]|uniref:hypothetical protein n=1 Tax=Ferruginibacter sp. HRS2-29 TaxID=2487334 RepID=UPI0020CD618E|nr:hypothetical protein [Ferruginibacter sp. HRS2-29]MCP9749665.1 hypothetical protein [Ferruginibacter sp. HRS2-29]